MTKKTSLLTGDLTLGAIDLYVKDIGRMALFYKDVLGLAVLEKTTEKISFGFEKNQLVTLHKASSRKPAASHHAGLYHFAILFASRALLAKTIQRILVHSPQFFVGSADHLVSEAFYFSDPEGNGIELYFDRDESSWQWQNGQVSMATQYLDPAEYIETHLSTNAVLPQDAKMGHFHLKVGDVDAAHTFYVDVLGFDITARLHGALFVSVGGYHHHFGLNAWESAGAGKREESLGLKSVQFSLQSSEDLEELRKRLTKNSIQFTEVGNLISFEDPWGNELIVTSL